MKGEGAPQQSMLVIVKLRYFALWGLRTRIIK